MKRYISKTGFWCLLHLSLISTLVSLYLFGCGGTALLPNVETQKAEEPTQPVIELKPRPVFHDFELPYPVVIYQILPIPALIKTEVVRSVELVLTIDMSGEVTSVESVSTKDSAFVECYKHDLRILTFEPGRKNDMPVATRLPILMKVGAIGSEPKLIFPVKRDRAVIETDLYMKALELNGFVLPAIGMFPSYRLDGDILPVYAFVLFRLGIDETGQLTSIEPVISTMKNLTRRLQAAVNWGSYTPLQVDGQPVASTAYLLISHHPAIEYPTVSVDPLSPDSTGWLDDWRVQLFADTVGLMSKPVPQDFVDGAITLIRAELLDNTVYSVDMLVDTSGRCTRKGVAPLSKGIHRAIQGANIAPELVTIGRLLLYLRFYPALDFNGNANPYECTMYLIPEDERNVRVCYDWLSDCSSMFLTQDTTK